MQTLRRLLFLTALVAVLVSMLATPAVAQRSIVIERFDAYVEVKPDGTVMVTETIEPRFTGSWNGLIRSIPVEYRTPQGLNYSLLIDVVSITDGSGRDLRWEGSRARHYREFKIWVPGAADATRKIEFTYRVRNALRFFEEHDELYWNVTGDEWEMPIEAASATIVLPAGATGIRTLVFTGGYGSREAEASTNINGNLIHVRMSRRLDFRENMTAVVGWDKGIVKAPGAVDKIALFLRSNWPLFLPIVVFVLMYWRWHTVGRDPHLRPIAAQYSPPEGMTPAEIGTLIDNSVDMRDITATIVDLAVRGYILIEEKKKSELLGLLSSTDYAFHRQRTDTNELKPHERELMTALFSFGNPVELSDLENRFYKNLPKVQDKIFDQLIARRYYTRRPDRVRQAYIGGGVVLGLIVAIGGTAISDQMGMAPATMILAGVLSGVIMIAFGWIMPARTVEGARVLEGVLGFEEFLNRVESDRLNRMVKTPEMFEKFLPFAMALGLEKKWAAAFDDIAKQPPNWYRGHSPMTSFRARAFTSDLGRMTSRASTAMRSAPRSSGGSGFGGGGGGGGFSGGGFGGGGGRGF